MLYLCSMKKLSIIVPIYNVEKYIRACIESIFNQGLSEDDFELILVNDGTPDKSLDVISDIIQTHNNIILINQPNQGPSIARNNGMMKASGEYIHFVDSDDLLVENSLSILLNEATKSNMDLVVADFLELSNNNIGTADINIPKNIKSCKRSGDDIYLEYLSPHDCHVWHTLFRRQFLLDNNITFSPGIYYEDIPYMHECYIKAKTCVKTNIPIYIYRRGNQMSITLNFSERTGKDFCTTIAMMWELAKNKNLSHRVVTKIKENVYVSFSVLVYCIAHDIHHKSERKAILNHIKKIAPDLQFKLGFKQKSMNFIYHRMPNSYIFLRVVYAQKFEKSIKRVKRLYKKIRNYRKVSSI